MRVQDYAYLVVLAGLWASVIFWRVKARTTGELWWACVCLVVVITFKIGVIAHPFRAATGGIYADQLLIHLVAIVLVTLMLSWSVLVRYGTRQAFRRLRLGGAAAMLVFLVATWFAAPVYDIPASADWIPADVQIAPVMAVHWLGFHSYLVAFCAAFIALARPAARTLPRGSVRRSIRMLITGAGLFGVKSGVEAIAQIVTIATARPEPPWLIAAVNPVVLVVFALFLAAVGLPLIQRSTGGGDRHGDGDVRIDSIWRWIEAADRAEPGSRATSTTAR